MLIPWGVMTSHKRSIIDKKCCKLTNIELLIDTIHEKVITKERSHI